MSDSTGTFLRSLLTPSQAAGQAVGRRASLVRLLLAGALILGLLALAPAMATHWGMLAAIAISLGYGLLSVMVVSRAEYQLQLLALVLIVYALGLAELLNTGNPANAIFYFILSIVFATMIWSLLAGATAAALALVTLGAVGLLLLTRALHIPSAALQPTQLADWIRSVLAILLAAMAVIAGFQQLQLEFGRAERKLSETLDDLTKERSTQEERVGARTVQWRAVLEVSRAASTIHDPDQLVAEMVNLISDRFGYYYAAVFLLNEEGDRAVLRQATGEAGRLLKENRHSLPVGGQSMVGTAIRGRQPRVALDTEAEAVRFANPLLPYTRSEIAVPLIVGDRVLGALDVQSTSPGAFGPAETDTLQGMANQVAIAFENARLFQEARRSLEELQAVQRQYIASAWRRQTGREDLQYSLGEKDISAGSAQIDVPLSLRDQIIGEINLTGEGDWTADQRSLVEAIATQAALALENARLVESTQSTAQREHLLAEITAKVWSSATLDGILRTAVGELGTALDADHATIELRMDDLNE